MKGNSKMTLHILHCLDKYIEFLAPLFDGFSAPSKNQNWALIHQNTGESLIKSHYGWLTVEGLFSSTPKK